MSIFPQSGTISVEDDGAVRVHTRGSTIEVGTFEVLRNGRWRVRTRSDPSFLGWVTAVGHGDGDAVLAAIRDMASQAFNTDASEWAVRFNQADGAVAAWSKEER